MRQLLFRFLICFVVLVGAFVTVFLSQCTYTDRDFVPQRTNPSHDKLVEDDKKQPEEMTRRQEDMKPEPESREDKVKLLQRWINLTMAIGDMNAFPPAAGWTRIGGASFVREATDRWHKRTGMTLEARNMTFRSCGETGDGHFLEMMPFPSLCKRRYSMDAYDKRADLKVNLMTPLSDASRPVQRMVGAMNLIVSHQVLEHVPEPLMAMVTLNALLADNGTLLLSIPFVVQDHRGPYDFQRFTIQKMALMVSCAGFVAEDLEGQGSFVTSMAYLAGVGYGAMKEKWTSSGCKGVMGCKHKSYSNLVVMAIKNRNVTLQEVADCVIAGKVPNW
eukprot:TRINITY_DN113761_c0_g1_i1.p1 TRINITY_DN113761_c0_g1~~TRINITY_DN113761_c0_g1_i1.p1  ORF type:complete len:332 (-),score=20.94 TRINITY_DN113761_c0_g1_i1:20-1015(-)